MHLYWFPVLIGVGYMRLGAIECVVILPLGRIVNHEAAVDDIEVSHIGNLPHPALSEALSEALHGLYRDIQAAAAAGKLSAQ